MHIAPRLRWPGIVGRRHRLEPERLGFTAWLSSEQSDLSLLACALGRGAGQEQGHLTG